MKRDNETRADNQQERLFYAGWIVGFVDGEGCFSVSIFRNKKTRFGWQIFPEFVVTQGERSIQVLYDLKSYFLCGNVFINRRHDNHREAVHRYCVRSLQDLESHIIPFFRQYELKTDKQQDFIQFAKIVALMREQKHFSKQGLCSIAQLVGKTI